MENNNEVQNDANVGNEVLADVIDIAFKRLLITFDGNEHYARLCAIKVCSVLKQIRIWDRIVTDEEINDWEQLSKYYL